MILVDKDVEAFLCNGSLDEPYGQTAIHDGDESCVTNIGYDLRTRCILKDGKELSTCALEPGESVFIESEETVDFDCVTVGMVVLKNSRIRMGLTMSAPVYQPGHKTRIHCRLTNISQSTLMVEAGAKYVTLIFEQLGQSPEKPYDGTFQNEFSFKNLAGYTSEYADSIKSIKGKIESIEDIEKTIYGNVITILTIFVAVFTLLNVNVSMAKAAASAIDFLIYNLSILGVVSSLALLMSGLLVKDKGKAYWFLWALPLVCFAMLVVIAICFV